MTVRGRVDFSWSSDSDSSSPTATICGIAIATEVFYLDVLACCGRIATIVAFKSILHDLAISIQVKLW